MKSGMKSASIIVLAVLVESCASSGYSPPPERRAGEQCPVGETWVCRDRYPSRMDRENEEGIFCTCESLQRIH